MKSESELILPHHALDRTIRLRIVFRAFLLAVAFENRPFNRVTQLEVQYADGNVPRPSYWGGYRLVPTLVEFWQGRSNRLHDRIIFRRESPAEPWERSRLAP